MKREQVISLCKERLLRRKADLLDRMASHRREFMERDTASKGDEADQSMTILNEHQLFANQRLIRDQLLMVEQALARIETNQYGFCEETEEEIETDRLLVIPWTTLSIEGAEIREASQSQTRTSP